MHLCLSLSFSIVDDMKPATLLKIRLQHRYFPVNFVKFLRTPLFTEHLQWLFLDVFTVVIMESALYLHIAFQKSLCEQDTRLSGS